VHALTASENAQNQQIHLAEQLVLHALAPFQSMSMGES